ncbi:MAG: alpha/beta hydrolase [Deinococcota bacterium]
MTRTTSISNLLPGFQSQIGQVEDLNLHYVIGGQGEPLVLLHGWGSSWYMWRKIMPTLAQHYTVIAIDLPGLGDSDIPEDGYSKAQTATRIRTLVQSLEIQSHSRIKLVGHDIGLMVAHAYAYTYSDEISHLVLLEAPIADESLFSFPALTPHGPGAWNFGFFNLSELPEALIEGKEAYFLEYFVRRLTLQQAAFTADDFAEYARTYSQADRLKASFDYFRSFADDVVHTQQYAQTPLDMPVLALDGDSSMGGFLPEQVKRYAKNVRGASLARCGHWLPEEQPEKLLEHLLPFLNTEL